jgi:hypothetical protein
LGASNIRRNIVRQRLSWELTINSFTPGHLNITIIRRQHDVFIEVAKIGDLRI